MKFYTILEYTVYNVCVVFCVVFLCMSYHWFRFVCYLACVRFCFVFLSFVCFLFFLFVLFVFAFLFRIMGRICVAFLINCINKHRSPRYSSSFLGNLSCVFCFVYVFVYGFLLKFRKLPVCGPNVRCKSEIDEFVKKRNNQSNRLASGISR